MEAELQYIEATQNGDARAFGVLYDLYIRQIYDFIYYRTLHRETAEDLTSQTFMKALKQIGKYNPSKGTFSAWLYRIARNTVIDHYRTRKSDIPIETVFDLADPQEIDIDARRKLEQIQEALQTLKPAQRELIIMRVWEQKSYKEIADILGKTEAGCKVAYARSIKKLRDLVPLGIYLLLMTNL